MHADAGSNRPGRTRRRRWASAALALVAAWLLAVAAGTLDNLPATALADAGVVDTSAQQAPSAGWGQEVLAVAREQAFELTPFSIANACGIGASSCFKCHNGTRASAPKSDKATNPWHPDHKTVNDSCVGCHGGNARLIKKEIAHANLVKDPRPKPEMCSKCHQSGDLAGLQKKYQIAAGSK